MDKDWCGAAAVLASAKDRYEHGKHFAVSSCSFTSLVPILSLEFSRILCVLPQCVSLGTNNQMRASGREWVLANTNISGYYRVNYDLDNWDRLLTLLDNNHRVSHKCFRREWDWCCFFYCLCWYSLLEQLFTAAWVFIRHTLQVLPVINRAQIIDDTFNLARYARQLRNMM